MLSQSGFLNKIFCIDWLSKLQWLWLLVAAPIALQMVFITPPFQVPDEPYHFYRALQVGDGVLLPATPGWQINKSAVEIVQFPGFTKLIHQPDKKIDSIEEKANHISEKKWSRDTVYVSFVNSALYPPVGYFITAAALRLSQAADLTVLHSFYMARLANCLIALALCFFAIKITHRGKMVMAIILLMPTTLFEFASLSQDALLVSAEVLAIGLFSRILDQKTIVAEGVTPIIMWVLFTIAFLCKPPYMLFVAGIVILGFISGKTNNKTFLTGAILSVVAVLGWLLAIRDLMHVPLLLDTNINSAQQSSLVLHDPAKFLMIAVNNFFSRGKYNLMTFVGVLGWQDTLLPPLVYIGSFLLLAITFFAGAHEFLKRAYACQQICAVIVPSLLTILLISLILYVTYTPVGADVIDGLQGRYYIPIALFLCLIVDDLKPLNPVMNTLYVYGIFIAFAVFDLSAVSCLVNRYYS